jgi:Ca2+-binding EF-hand superfamily protein
MYLEFAQLIQKMGIPMTPNEMHAALCFLDENGDGVIDLDEFIKWFTVVNSRV